MKAVTSALAGGVITPGEAGTIAAVVDVFFRAIETNDFERRSREAEDGPSRNSGRGPAVWRRAELSTVKRFCCSFAAGAENAESWDDCGLRPGTVGAAA
jgi:hypothetical protein